MKSQQLGSLIPTIIAVLIVVIALAFIQEFKAKRAGNAPTVTGQ